MFSQELRLSAEEAANILRICGEHGFEVTCYKHGNGPDEPEADVTFIGLDWDGLRRSVFATLNESRAHLKTTRIVSKRLS